MTGTETLYFGDFLSPNKEWWQGSAPISCTLHWRQVRRNYLFQGGYPRYHLICPPSWFPQSPGTVGYWPHPWRQVWNFYSRVATPSTTRTALPQEGPLPGPLLSSRPSLPPTFYPQPVCYFLNVVSLGRLWLGLKTGSLIVHLVKHSRLPVYKLNMHTYNLIYNMVGHTPCYIWKHSCL